LWLDQDYAAPQLFWPNVIRAHGLAIFMGPIALVGIAEGAAGAASGLFNIMGNLGGAIGTAIGSFFTHREQFHSALITPKVSLVYPAMRDRLATLQQYLWRTAILTRQARCTARSSQRSAKCDVDAGK
jgi:DHA2 family multidrug resistance protein